MTKRLLSLLLAFMMLLSICLSTASCGLLGGGDGEGEGTGEGTGEGSGEGEGEGGGEGDGTGTNKGDPDVPLMDGYNQITFFWDNDFGPINHSLETSDLWCWWGDVEGRGYMMKPCEYGGMLTLNIPENVSEVGFIVRTGCSEPGGDTWAKANKNSGDIDLFATIEGRETFIYLRAGENIQYSSTNGGKTLTVIKKFSLAGITALDKIKYNLVPKTKLTDISQVKVYDGDREIEVLKVNSIGKSTDTGTITVAEELDLERTYRVEIENYGSTNAVPTGIFDTDYFADKYNYDGDDLGAVINGNNTTFKVWAPTATKVVLNLFHDGHTGEAYKEIEMVRGDKGVWSHTEACGHGTYYTYTVTTAVGTQEAVDPYAKSAGLNGNRGMVVDLSLTNPEGWEADRAFETGIESYSDAIIWEVHVRDFSYTIESAKYPGKYLAFTETGLKNEHGQSVGIDYLKELGVTHVHLLPVYDYATVKEDKPDEKFNWGYDPKNYNVPEGSYSTNPYNGEVRINEYKQMVMALHEAGIGVIMDVVYNHTYDANSSFNKIVPYYYYRYTSSGANSNGSGCGNDTASERYMFGKFMVDSTRYWISEYNLDGFRFDLMGLHDLKTMQNVEKAVHEVDNHAVIYGEGWTMTTSAIGAPKMANQSNISQIRPSNGAIGGIAVFNDVTRDGLKGSSFEEKSIGYISNAESVNNGSALARITFGIKGGVGSGYGWSVSGMVVNYMSSHDNHTLWDKLTISVGGASKADRLAMNRLGATVLMVSKGIVFFQAGEEFLRSKPNPKGGYDENSYKSSDEVNNIKWNVLKAGSDELNMSKYYQGLISIRNNIDIFSSNFTSISDKKLSANGGAYIYKDLYNKDSRAIVILNPSSSSINCNLNDIGGADGVTYYLICNGVKAGTVSLGTYSGNIQVPKCSAYILVTEDLLPQ